MQHISVSKEELSKWAIDYRKKGRDDRILVSIEHCVLIENQEVLLERPGTYIKKVVVLF